MEHQDHREYRNKLMTLCNKHKLTAPKQYHKMKTGHLEWLLISNGIRLPLSKGYELQWNPNQSKAEKLVNKRIHLDRVIKDSQLELIEVKAKLKEIQKSCTHEIEEHGVMRRCSLCRLEWTIYEKRPTMRKHKDRSKNEQYRPIVTVKEVKSGIPTVLEISDNEYILRK